MCQTKRWFAFSKIVFCAGTNVFEEALTAVKFLGWLKKFGPAQNILGPVKGQGISLFADKIFTDQMDFTPSLCVCTAQPILFRTLWITKHDATYFRYHSSFIISLLCSLQQLLMLNVTKGFFYFSRLEASCLFSI